MPLSTLARTTLWRSVPKAGSDASCVALLGIGVGRRGRFAPAGLGILWVRRFPPGTTCSLPDITDSQRSHADSTM